jgi:Terminase large subunit, T4likevirus-type, N-terminal/Terminase RNaseH-like domain
MSNKIELNLPAPHPAQAKLIHAARRFNVLCCGRRWGKTVLGMDRLIHPALEGKPVAWFSPTNKLMSDAWRAVRTTLAPVTVDKSEQEKRLELIGGGVIDFWSLDSPDSGRGRKYAVVVVDEAAMISELSEAWQQSIRPTLTDLQGSAWFLSTPKGMNYFKALFDRGQDPEREDWVSWQMPTSANPYIQPGEIELARLDLTEAAFNQEYSALFVNWEGSVFRRVDEAATATEMNKPEPGHDYVIGCDWGRSKDYTVFIVLDTTAHAIVKMDRSNRTDYVVQVDRLKVLSDYWQPSQIIAEQNGIGQPVIEQLTREGLQIQPFTTTNASKAQAIEALALAFERADIRILNDPNLVSELVAYQAERLPSGLIRYGAPGGGHDDMVTSLALAWSAVSSQHRLIYSVPERDIVVPEFSIPAHWPRGYGLDSRWQTAAAIWGAYDPQSDVLYLYSEYCADADPAVHAAAIRARAEWIPGLFDLAANGRNRSDGARLNQMYRAHGLHLEHIDNSIESGIMEVSQRMQSGRLKVFPSLTKYLGERRLYRRDESGQVVKDRDNLQDATRCLVIGISRMITETVEEEDEDDYGGRFEQFHHGPGAWMR